MVSKDKKQNFQALKKNLPFTGILGFELSSLLSFLDMSKKREYVSQLSKKQTRYETHAYPHQCTWNDNFPGFKQQQHLQKWAYFKFCLRWRWQHRGLISKHDTSWMAELYGEEINSNIWPLRNSLKV